MEDGTVVEGEIGGYIMAVVFQLVEVHRWVEVQFWYPNWGRLINGYVEIGHCWCSNKCHSKKEQQV